MYFFGAGETKATDKALAGRQTCLAGDQIQPRDKNGRMDSGLAEPHSLRRTAGGRYNRQPGQQPQRAREATDREVWIQKGNEAPRPGHSLTSWALPRCGLGPPRLPVSPPESAGSLSPVCFLLCSPAFRIQSLQVQGASNLAAATSHVRHAVGSART